MASLDGYEVGQKVELKDGRLGTVQFVGTTHFAEGPWIGLVLEDRSGKNDGAVQGQRYFQCESGRGMFVRPTGVASIREQPSTNSTKRPPAASQAAGSKARVSARPSAVGAATKRQSLVDPTEKRRAAVNASPTPAGKLTTRAPALRTPSKSPTKQLSSRPSSGASSLRGASHTAAAKPGGAAGARTSISGRLAESSRPNMRPSVGGATTNGPVRPPSTSARKPANRLSSLQYGRSGSASSTSRSVQSEQMSPTESQDRDNDSQANEDEDRTLQSPTRSLQSPTKSVQSPTEPLQSPTNADVTPKPARSAAPQKSSEKPAAPAQRAPTSSSAVSRENEDLKTKVRLLDKKCVEYRDKLKNLEKVKEERDKFEGIIQKLQKKYQPQQQEIADLKKQVKELESRAETNESKEMDIDTAVEIATLDREMAEETAEAAKQELEIIRQEYEELKLEVEILREENSELGKEMSPEERSSQGWMQLERSNERLREALMRLRDVTQDTEAELKEQIQELEADVKDFASLKQEHEQLKEKSGQAESLVEDLRAQLETAGGAEDMLEELTENNLALKEQIDGLKAAIEDLENLKELNDELEQNHIENERQMQEDIDYQEAEILEHRRALAEKDEVNKELEYAAERYQELVRNLKQDLSDVRASQNITEQEASDLSSRSKAMMDLNLKLQATATKTQVKAIDMEMGKLDAQEAKDQLSIVQSFLPETYTSNRDSVDAFLRVKRIGFKANLVHSFVKERAGGLAVPGHEEEMLGACDALDKLTWVSAMCQRLAGFIQRCSLPAFQKFAGAMYDLEPVERTFNSSIESLKRDDFKDRRYATELGRSVALMTHLAEAHISEGLVEFAEDVHMRALIVQSHLESSAFVISQVKSITQATLILPTDADEQDEAEAEAFIVKADELVSQLRSTKVVAGKAVHNLADLKSRSLTLVPSTSDQIDQYEVAAREYAAACQSSASALLSLLSEEERGDSFTYGEVTRALGQGDSTAFATLASKLRHVADQMQSWQSLTSSLSQTVEFTSDSTTPPWKLLSDQLKADVSASAAQEREMLRLKDELTERDTTIAMRDKALEELNVSVEVLNKRVTESQGRREQLRELEAKVESHSQKEQQAAADLLRAQEDLQRLEAERESWSKNAPVQALASGGGLTGGFTGQHGAPLHGEIPSAKAAEDIAFLKEEILTLQATIRQLRRSAYQTTLSKNNCSFLSTSLYPEPTPPVTMQSAFARETKDAFKALVDLTCGDKSRVPEITLRDQEHRLTWRPASQTVRWRVQQQAEQWEAWRDWRDDLVKKQPAAMRSGSTGQPGTTAPGKKATRDRPLAYLGVSLPGKEWEKVTRQVKIVRPEDWGEIEKDFGVA